ncbi:MAG: DUF3307 domain-containing protein [Patescibacteria group bacterium]
MIILHLIFAHLLADFVLQPGKLIRWKMHSGMGILVHVLIHLVITLLVLIPYLINGHVWPLIVAGGVAFCHFWIDQTKINYDLKHDKKVLPFLLDQALHFSTLFVAAFTLSEGDLILPNGSFYELYTNPGLISFLCFSILFTVAIEIYHFQKQREKNNTAKLNINNRKMLQRMLILTVMYILFLFIYYSGFSG